MQRFNFYCTFIFRCWNRNQRIKMEFHSYLLYEYNNRWYYDLCFMVQCGQYPGGGEQYQGSPLRLHHPRQRAYLHRVPRAVQVVLQHPRRNPTVPWQSRLKKYIHSHFGLLRRRWGCQLRNRDTCQLTSIEENWNSARRENSRDSPVWSGVAEEGTVRRDWLHGARVTQQSGGRPQLNEPTVLL